jgi:AcrR family transcriptional regulator
MAARCRSSAATRPGSDLLTESHHSLTPAKRRVVVAARELFVEHGVAATSLQMIADKLGVTKAAVYHQFPTKHAIVKASAEFEVDTLEQALEAAEAEPDRSKGIDILLAKAIEIAVRRRKEVISLQSDPVMKAVLYSNERFRDVTQRYLNFVVGTDTPEGLVRAAMLASVIGRTVSNPLVFDLDDETLRTTLFTVARRMVPEELG